MKAAATFPPRSTAGCICHQKTEALYRAVLPLDPTWIAAASNPSAGGASIRLKFQPLLHCDRSLAMAFHLWAGFLCCSSRWRRRSWALHLFRLLLRNRGRSSHWRSRSWALHLCCRSWCLCGRAFPANLRLFFLFCPFLVATLLGFVFLLSIISSTKGFLQLHGHLDRWSSITRLILLGILINDSISKSQRFFHRSLCFRLNNFYLRSCSHSWCCESCRCRSWCW